MTSVHGRWRITRRNCGNCCINYIGCIVAKTSLGTWVDCIGTTLCRPEWSHMVLYQKLDSCCMSVRLFFCYLPFHWSQLKELERSLPSFSNIFSPDFFPFFNSSWTINKHLCPIQHVFFKVVNYFSLTEAYVSVGSLLSRVSLDLPFAWLSFTLDRVQMDRVECD